jgi:hypothetical protein
MIDNIVLMIVEKKRLEGMEEDYSRWNERLTSYKNWIEKSKL